MGIQGLSYAAWEVAGSAIVGCSLAWTAGETRVGRGTEGDGDGDGERSTNGLVPPPSLRHRDKPSEEQTPRR